MTEQNRDDGRDEFEIEITDLDPQEKRHALSAFWHYGTSHRLQMRIWMMVLVLVGVALFTGAVLSPFLLQGAPRATKAPDGTPFPVAQQSPACPQAGSGSLVIATATGDESISWWQGQLVSTKVLQGRCLHLILVHNLSPGENTIEWVAGG